MSSSNLSPESMRQALLDRTLTIEDALRILVNADQDINLKLLDDQLSKRFFNHFSRKDIKPSVIPLLLLQGKFYLGCPTLLSQTEIDRIQHQTQTQIEIIPITLRSYRLWQQYQGLKSQKKFKPHEETGLDNRVSTDELREVTQLYLAEETGQIQRIMSLIRGALRSGASDIHIEPLPDGLRVRYRIDGVLRQHVTFDPREGRRLVVALKVMCDMDIAESRSPQDGRIEKRYVSDYSDLLELDLRVSTLPCINSRGQEEKVVLRLLRHQNSFQTLDDIGFTAPALKTYQRWLREPQGLILFVGPTGSGKTSTLYTSLQTLARDTVNITTVENPVEYLLPGITQTQVHEAAGMSFATGLRAILRQDPDIIMVGETRDEETAKIVIQAALTGHLVFSTLHANDALGTIPRLRDIGREAGLISDALLGVVAQRLLRKNCPYCSQPYVPTPEELALFQLGKSSDTELQWRKGVGCDHCFQSGYLGREAVIELLDVDDAIRSFIYQGDLVKMSAYLREQNFQSFAMAAAEKVSKGITTSEEVLRGVGRRFLMRSY